MCKEVPNGFASISKTIQRTIPTKSPVTKYQNLREQTVKPALVKTEALSLLLLGSWIRKGYPEP